MPLKRLFKSAFKSQASWPRIASGRRIYAIGDIHGRYDLLKTLIGKIVDHAQCLEPAETQIIFLGDLIDRGPQSKEVIDYLINLHASFDHRLTFIKGNHEEMLLEAGRGDKRAASLFNRNGGRETLLSYGVSAEAYDSASLAELADIISEYVPKSHMEFMASFLPFYDEGDYFFVHAGVRPNVPLSEQKSSDLRWIRREFLDYDRRHEKMIVHGHSVKEDVDERSNRIGIDTGAYRTGTLTAIYIEGGQYYFIQAKEDG